MTEPLSESDVREIAELLDISPPGFPSRDDGRRLIATID